MPIINVVIINDEYYYIYDATIRTTLGFSWIKKSLNHFFLNSLTAVFAWSFTTRWKDTTYINNNNNFYVRQKKKIMKMLTIVFIIFI